jgi:hypothetical protein
MSGIVPIAQGDEIPLVLQLPDGDETQFPRALIYNDAGGFVTQADLSHTANGLYINVGTAVVMTAAPFLSAVFITYSNAGRTTESTKYTRASETFALLDATIDSILTAVNSIPADVWTRIIEAGYTAEQMIRLIAAPIAGRASGSGTGTETYEGVDEATARIVATVDASGNRTAVVKDAS